MRSLSYLLLGLLLSAVATAQNDAHKIAESVDRRYNNMHSLEAQFTETYRGAGMARNESGTLW
ncbi:MAG: hypothetical protein ACXVG9_09510, partial [Terriglobales bacterium]